MVGLAVVYGMDEVVDAIVGEEEEKEEEEDSNQLPVSKFTQPPEVPFNPHPDPNSTPPSGVT